jgi:prepilin-type processing-associated H-X9-DG protein
VDGNSNALFFDGSDGKMNVNHEFIGKWKFRIFW